MRSKKKWWWLAAVSVVSLAVFFGWLFYQPKYQGRPVSDWVTDLDSTNQMTSVSAVYVMLEMGPEAVPFLQREIETQGPDNHPQLRQWVTKVSQRLPTSMEKAVLKRFGYYPKASGIGAAQTLGFLREDSREAIPTLLRSLEDPDVNVRTRAATALIAIAPNDKAVLKPLFEAVRTDQQKWLYEDFGSAFPLVITNSPNLVPFLLEAYPKGELTMRIKMLTALGRAPSPSEKVRAFLYSELREDPMAATGAAVGLAESGEITEEVVEALVQGVVGRNLPAGANLQPLEKYIAAHKLADLGAQAKTATETMRKLLNAKEFILQVYAINFLVSCGEARSNLPPVLVGNLADGNKRMVYLPAVKEIHPDDRQRMVEVAGLLNNPATRVAALNALAHFGKDAATYVERMEPFLTDEKLDIRLTTTAAIAKIQPENAKLHVAIKKALAEGGYLTKLETVKLIQTQPEFVERYRSELQTLMKEKGERLRKAVEQSLGLVKK